MVKRKKLSVAGVLLSICTTFWGANAQVSSSPTTRATIETLPQARGGQDLVGARFPKVDFARWLNTPDNKPIDTAGSVTLYRWWTDTCPYCEVTLPAIEQLRKKYESKGLKVVAVFHPKPPGEVVDERILSAAKERQYHGPIAVDPMWSALRQTWLAPLGMVHRQRATSVSFLVDRAGVIRFVHPGVMFYPSLKPGDAEENHDYELIDRAIGQLLDEPHAP